MFPTYSVPYPTNLGYIVIEVTDSRHGLYDCKMIMRSQDENIKESNINTCDAPSFARRPMHRVFRLQYRLKDKKFCDRHNYSMHCRVSPIKYNE